VIHYDTAQVDHPKKRRAWARVVRLLPLCVLLGCAELLDSERPPHSEAVRLRRDELKGITTYEGPERRAGPDAGYSIHAWRNPDDSLRFQLYVRTDFYGDSRDFDRAIGEDQTPLEVTKIKSTVVSCQNSEYTQQCALSETFAATIPLDAMEKAAAGAGYAVRFSPEHGDDITIRISALYASQMLKATASEAPPPAGAILIQPRSDR
jgi:hypothetical protein